MLRLLFTSLLALLVLPVAAREQDPFERLDALGAYERDEVVWLARCVLSESNRADEQRLVAWVVRNRVETGYRGTTYREVVLEPYQFSAFNEDSKNRRYLLGLDAADRDEKAWKGVLGVALDVYHAPASERPFSIETRHFYSPVSMPGRATPRWAEGRAPVALATYVDPDRFRFYEGVDYGADAPRGATLTHVRGEEGEGMVRRRTSLGERLEARRARLKTSIPRPARPTSPGRAGSR